jgi:HAD superfamily hydrolase (TIGR01509 family)
MFINKARLGLFFTFSILFSIGFNAIDSKSDLAQKDVYYVFFDIGDVLLKTSKARSFTKNKAAIVKYIFRHGLPNGTYLKKRLFQMMDYTTNLPRGSATNNGEFVPGIMCDWLIGKVDSTTFIKIITNINPADSFFESKAEANLLIGIAKLMLPNALTDIHKTTKSIQTLRKCVECAPDRVCILSNWDKDSIGLLKEKFPEIFTGIDDSQIIFSGECGYKKPDHNIYEFAANKVGISPEQCILIDDQPDNIDSAEKCGWQGIYHTNDTKTANFLEARYGFYCSA